METENWSLDEIQRQLAEANARRDELESLLKAKREESKGAVVEQIRSMILDNGYDPAEIMRLVLRGRRKARDTGASTTGRRRYVDPDNPANTYARGVLPGWMKEKMIEQGLDPASKADREHFKQNSLTLIED